MKRRNRFAALLLACLLLVPAALAEGSAVTISEEDYELLQKYKRLEEILSIIDDIYLWEYDKDALMTGAAQGILAALGDDYAYYYSTDEMEVETENITGEYVGIGIEVFGNLTDNTITIRRVFHGGPAQQAGLRMNDKILQINGEDVTAYDLNHAVSIMRGKEGEELELTMLRDTEVFVVTCERAKVETETISYEMLEEDIGYVRLHYFEGHATEQFQKMMEEFQAAGAKGLIIDLRDNPGGLLNLAIDIASFFLDDVVVMHQEDKFGRRISHYANEGAWEIPVVVLINGYSASASEIVAAALHDNGVAKLVGTKTFGKGIMQQMHTFRSDGAGMQITSEYWLTPNGDIIHGEGIAPDVEVEQEEDVYDENYNRIREKDTQLQKGVEVLKEEIAGE